MTVFCIVAVSPGQGLAAAVQAAFPDDHLQVTPTFWLVSAKGTAQDVSNRIGVTPDAKPEIGTAVVAAMAGYYGRAPANVWEWVKAKLETSGA